MVTLTSPLCCVLLQAAHAAAVAAATAVVNEAAAGAYKDLVTAEGMSEEEKIARIAAAKEKRMQDIVSALAVLASNSGTGMLFAMPQHFFCLAQFYENQALAAACCVWVSFM